MNTKGLPYSRHKLVGITRDKQTGRMFLRLFSPRSGYKTRTATPELLRVFMPAAPLETLQEMCK